MRLLHQKFDTKPILTDFGKFIKTEIFIGYVKFEQCYVILESSLQWVRVCLYMSVCKRSCLCVCLWVLIFVNVQSEKLATYDLSNLLSPTL